ncbi:MAG: ABC transporter permease, partial [bacterium]
MAEKRKTWWIAAFWLLVWQGAAILIHNPILLVGPWETALALRALVREGSFWLAVGSTLGHIALGFLLGALGGGLTAALAGRFRLFRELITPLMRTVKAVPVVSFVILALIWMGSRLLSFLVTLTVVSPIFYFNTLEGLDATDRKLLELARVYRMRFPARLRGIYAPQLRPYLVSAAEL